MKNYGFRICLETYKNVKLQISQNCEIAFY